MTDLDCKRELVQYFTFGLCSLYVCQFMESIFVPVPITPINIDPSIINEKWPRFIIISDVNFAQISPFVPCILSSVNLELTGLLKLFCDYPNSTWEHVNNILTSITKGLEYAVTGNFTNSVHPDIDFGHCLFPYCSNDHVVTSCMRLLSKSPWFTIVHTEVGGSASFAFLDKGMKIGVLLLHLPVLTSLKVVIIPLKVL